MVSVAPVSLLLALVLTAQAASLQDSSVREPESPLDVPHPAGIATLPAKRPESLGTPGGAPGAGAVPGGRDRRETPEAKPIPHQPNRPVIKPLSSQPVPPANKPSTQPAVPNRQGLTKPAPQPSPHQTRPVRESVTGAPHTGLQKPQPLPGTANAHKPQPLPGQTGLNGNRQGLTKPAPTPAKPAHTNSQKPQTQPLQTGLNGNRQGLTKPAPLPAHARPERHAIDDEPKPQVLPAIPGTQKPQTLPALVDGQKPQTLPAIAEYEKPDTLPAPIGTHRPQTIPAYVGTLRPQTIPAFVGTERPLTFVDPIPPNLGSLSSDRPVRDTFSDASPDARRREQATTFPAAISPSKPPQALPPVGTLPALNGNREGLLRPAPLPAQSGSP